MEKNRLKGGTSIGVPQKDLGTLTDLPSSNYLSIGMNRKRTNATIVVYVMYL